MFCGRIVHFEVPDSGNPMPKGEVERRVSLINEVVNAFAILLDMASRLEQIGQFHFSVMPNRTLSPSTLMPICLSRSL